MGRGEALRADRYSLIEPIGSGGTGQVWRAWGTAMGRQVAVKLLAAAGDAPVVAQYFA
ncbi:hypothetical protein [Streptomyces sporangiiformans]|uniref:hypothetical protein n=1 Tax=Streptomyces sporangiiformans TaxID=2315329 RepID=UPI0013C403C9|nr:hypothetical protein [Streptomyces sporangiiformans]